MSTHPQDLRTGSRPMNDNGNASGSVNKNSVQSKLFPRFLSPGPFNLMPLFRDDQATNEENNRRL
jgi:hypothetical protein